MSLLSLVAEIATGYRAGGIGDPIAASRSLAREAGGEDILIFCYDYEVRAFLPAPPFAQTLPRSAAWQRFILSVDEDGGSAELPSPYRGSQLRPVQARRVDTETVVALIGRELPLGEEDEEFRIAVRLLGRIFSAARDVRIAQARAGLAAEAARANGEIASSLLATRKKLETSLAETRQERQKLRQSNERLQLAQQIASMGMWEWNWKTHSLQMSEEMRRMCGVGAEPPLAVLRRLLGTLDAADRKALGRALRLARRSGEPAEVEIRLPDGSGGRRWIASRMAADEKGGARLLGVSLDMTRRRRSEAALRRSEALASAGRLAAAIAHEINNPLESITNLLYIVAQDEELSSRTRECVRMAEDEIARVSHIARRTLAFYRDQVSPEDVDVADILRQTLQLYEPRLTQFRVQMDNTLPADYRLRGFPGELKQLFSNLLANAIDAMNEAQPRSGGRLAVSAGYTRGMLAVAFRDSGAGIDPLHMRNLFEPFFTTKSETGTGLGLWVSEGIAKKHGGRIEVESSIDPERHGTTVTVYLAGVEPAAVN